MKFVFYVIALYIWRKLIERAYRMFFRNMITDKKSLNIKYLSPKEIVGKRIGVYWIKRDVVSGWHSGLVKRYNSESGEHYIHYKDFHRWQNLSVDDVKLRVE